MPFRAIRNGEIVAPTAVPDHEAVECPECGNDMYTRRRRGEARHFYHANSAAGASCSTASTGESDTHARCVALAADALADQFNSQRTTCGIEVRIPLEKSYLGHDHRRADALLEFESPNPFFGRGIVVEVQHRNHQKNTTATNYDFLKAGYSVVWLSTADFDSDALDYAVIDRAFQSETGAGFSVREYDPWRFVDCQCFTSKGDHNWKTVPECVLEDAPEYEICVDKVCEVRRRYDEETGSYEYGIGSGVPSYFRPKLLRKALVRGGGFPNDGQILSQRYPVAPAEKAAAGRPEIERCRGPKGFHEWVFSERVQSGNRTTPTVELRACRYCPVHLLTRFGTRNSSRTDILFGNHPDPDLNLAELEENPDRCTHRSHDPERWYEYCPECGDTDPQ